MVDGWVATCGMAPGTTSCFFLLIINNGKKFEITIFTATHTLPVKNTRNS